ncbi:hypothetical protein [Demequina oxidasica]|uniref:hypothetical protein n=1 Tax=Demequina oxidasica TaxID=676199 RepID=UPI001364DA4C|nr:hypothetical protein [Demequina oxidasica]
MSAPPETPVASPSPSASATDSAPTPTDYGDPATWTITPSGIGPLTVDMTPAEVSTVTGVDYSADIKESEQAFGGACGAWLLGPDQPLTSMSVLVASEGIDGPVDVYMVDPYEQTDSAFPTTAEGLGVGSTKADVESVYGSDLQREDSLYVPRGERLWTEQAGEGILFETDGNGVVTSVRSGRLPQLRHSEGCA